MAVPRGAGVNGTRGAAGASSGAALEAARPPQPNLLTAQPTALRPQSATPASLTAAFSSEATSPPNVSAALFMAAAVSPSSRPTPRQ